MRRRLLRGGRAARCERERQAREEQRALALLGEACRQLREEHGLSRDEVASTAGIGLDRLAALEAGRLDPDLELLMSVAQSIGIRPSAIIARAEELER